MSIQLSQINISTDLVSNLVTKCNNHMDVTADIIGRITGSTGTDSVIMNSGTNSSAGNQGFVTGTNNSIASGSDNSAIIGGSGNSITGTTDNVVILGMTNRPTNEGGVHMNNLHLYNGTIKLHNSTGNAYGVVTLVGGEASVFTDAYVNASSTPVILTHQNSSGTLGELYIDENFSGAGTMVIKSTSATDTSKVFFWIMQL
jgi:hypothetical protein